MEQNKVLKIADYNIKEGDVFFFDNNIWMYVFCPLGNYNNKRQATYSKFLQYVLSRKSHIYINTLIISEFCNSYLRLDFALCNKTGNPETYNSFKKNYVGSARFEKTVKDIKVHLTKILNITKKCSDEFNAINMNDVLDLFEKIGFNDSYYTFQAKKKNWIVVSDDSDLSDNKIPQAGITILTR